MVTEAFLFDPFSLLSHCFCVPATKLAHISYRVVYRLRLLLSLQREATGVSASLLAIERGSRTWNLEKGYLYLEKLVPDFWLAQRRGQLSLEKESFGERRGLLLHIHWLLYCERLAVNPLRPHSEERQQVHRWLKPASSSWLLGAERLLGTCLLEGFLISWNCSKCSASDLSVMALYYLNLHKELKIMFF